MLHPIRHHLAKKYVGQWAVCARGFVGRIKGFTIDRGNIVYRGEKLDGTPWQSIDPRLIKDPVLLLDLNPQPASVAP